MTASILRPLIWTRKTPTEKLLTRQNFSQPNPFIQPHAMLCPINCHCSIFIYCCFSLVPLHGGKRCYNSGETEGRFFSLCFATWALPLQPCFTLPLLQLFTENISKNPTSLPAFGLWLSLRESDCWQSACIFRFWQSERQIIPDILLYHKRSKLQSQRFCVRSLLSNWLASYVTCVFKTCIMNAYICLTININIASATHSHCSFLFFPSLRIHLWKMHPEVSQMYMLTLPRCTPGSWVHVSEVFAWEKGCPNVYLWVPDTENIWWAGSLRSSAESSHLYSTKVIKLLLAVVSLQCVHPSLFQSYHCEKAHPVCPFLIHNVYSVFF